MVKQPPDEPGEGGLRITDPAREAAGLPAVLSSLRHGLDQMGARRSARTLLRVNQPGGFDCPGCAWPESATPHLADFCENGAKAVAEEATLRRLDRDFFARHSIADLAGRSDYWLGQQGRLTEPMVKRPDSEHYEPISWDDALDLVARALHALDSPDRAAFYTSGRTSNEAAFVYQLFARMLGTNNLPDCSDLCHQSSSHALAETLGVGKGSVSLDDIVAADLIFVVGQNPGTNHPRMLATLEAAKRGGTRIVTVNPLPEAGLIQFNNPQRPAGLLGRGTVLSDEFCQIRLNGDLAFFQALGHLLVTDHDAGRAVLDDDFVARHTTGFEAYAAHARGIDWQVVARATALDPAQIRRVHELVVASERIVVCWAMGLTQHRSAVATICEVVNFLLLRGNVGRRGAGVCPVRGHSNVQGDRTMGICERPPPEFLDALAAEFDFAPPRHHGHDVVEAIDAMRAGAVRVFFALGGNFVRAAPDTTVTEAALRGCALTVQVSTKLNHSHATVGDTALILPTLGRTERDAQASGEQLVSVEDSMSMVHASRGRLAPASDDLRSEVAIVCELAARTLSPDFGSPDLGVPWRELAADYDRIRDRIARVVPGFEDFNRRVREPGGFQLPHGVRDSRTFPTPTGRATFTVTDIDVLDLAPGRLLLQTLRSHDQFNTTIYGLDDRYRGVRGGRRVVFVNPDDLVALGIADAATVDLVSEWTNDGVLEERRAPAFRVVAYPTARGCAAAYFPETNVLVPLGSTAAGSNTPTSKSIVVRLEPTTA